MKVKIKPLHKGAHIPVKAHKSDAGYDLYTCEDVEVLSGRVVGKRAAVSVGFAIELPDPCSRWYWKFLKALGFTPYRYFARIRSRSGFTLKGMNGNEISRRVENGVHVILSSHNYDCDVLDGVVDSNYRNCIGVLICNRDNKFYLPAGTRIAQMTIEKAYEFDFVVAETLSDSERHGGFGHTGTK